MNDASGVMNDARSTHPATHCPVSVLQTGVGALQSASVAHAAQLPLLSQNGVGALHSESLLQPLRQV